MVARKDGSEYFKKRRETIGQFSVSVKREKLEALDKKLKEKGQTKTAWLNEKIDEEIGE
nr:MAG TPA: CopG-like protein [Caudoviricetes sp.]